MKAIKFTMNFDHERQVNAGTLLRDLTGLMLTEDSAEMKDVAGRMPLSASVTTGPLFVDPASAALPDKEDKPTYHACEVEALQRYDDKTSTAQTGAPRIGFNFRC